jgi:hypothetical protein
MVSSLRAYIGRFWNFANMPCSDPNITSKVITEWLPSLLIVNCHGMASSLTPNCKFPKHNKQLITECLHSLLIVNWYGMASLTPNCKFPKHNKQLIMECLCSLLIVNSQT